MYQLHLFPEWETLQMVASVLVTSRLDYCNEFYILGYPSKPFGSNSWSVLAVTQGFVITVLSAALVTIWLLRTIQDAVVT